MHWGRPKWAKSTAVCDKVSVWRMPLLLALGTNVANHQSGSELLSFERTSYAEMYVYSDEPALFARDAGTRRGRVGC